MKKLFLLFPLILFFIGCSKEPQKPPARQAAVQVPTALVVARDITNTVQTVGTVEAKDEATLSSKIMGAITDIRVSEGSVVRKGEILVTLDAADIAAKKQQAVEARAGGQAALKETEAAILGAKAALENARINYGRFKNLYKEQAVTKKELDDMSAQFKMAKAGEEQAAAKKKQVEAKIAQADAAIKETDVLLGYAVIRSPLNGAVTGKMANVGEMASPGRPLLKIVDNETLRLACEVKEGDIAGIKKGDTVKVAVDALGGGKLAGRVTEIVPAADPSTRSFTVKIDLPETPGLKSGMFGRAWLASGKRRAVLLPEAALVDKEGMKGVWVVTPESTLNFRAVRLGAKTDGEWEVLAGLSGGEKVAVGNVDNLQEGMKIK
ncbi:MAG: efflux RND transporter periplasmic adaptor subunit [Nitrospirota bacterium]